MRSLLKLGAALLFLACSLLSTQAFVNIKSGVNATNKPLFLSKEPAAWMNTGTGGLVFAGGVMGYAKAKSKASLIAGSTFGGLLVVSAYLIASPKQKKKKFGAALGSLVSGLLSYTMGKKFFRSGKFVPAGLVASFAVASCVVSLVEWIMATGSSEPVEF